MPVSSESQLLSIQFVFFLLHFTLFFVLRLSFIKTDRGLAADTSWQAAAWSIFRIHLDIFSAKKKQVLGTCSVPLASTRVTSFTAASQTAMLAVIACTCLPGVLTSCFQKDGYFRFPWEFALHRHVCVRAHVYLRPCACQWIMKNETKPLHSCFSLQNQCSW